MTIKFEVDFAQVERAALSLGASVDQIPYAIALALNRSADITRNLLIKQTWPSHIQPRNASFIAASLTTREARATKGSLAVEIYDRLRRGHLFEHAKGGVRVPHGRAHLAVPTKNVPKTARGVPQRLKPKALGKNAVRIKDALYRRDAKGKLILLYVLKPQTKIPKRVPFYEDYEASMRRELQRTLPMAVAQAMATRRR